MRLASLLLWWFTITGHPAIGPFVTYADCDGERAWVVGLADRHRITTTISRCEWRIEG